jgi:Delta7-sterol 5-desaturase
MPLYSLLPTVTEWAAENGYTKAYPRVSNVGLPLYVLYFFLYMTCVEFGVYWMHRGLHYDWAYRCDTRSVAAFGCGRPAARSQHRLQRWGLTFAVTCRLLHLPHHKYNKEHTLSPFAGARLHACALLLGLLAAGPAQLANHMFAHHLRSCAACLLYL